jgi:hypothetical protein
MAYIDKWRDRKERERLEHEIHLKKHLEEEESQKEEILEELSRFGITDVNTNGYFFGFIYNKLKIGLTNQDTRLLCEMYREDLTEEEERCVREDAHLIDRDITSRILGDEFKRDFNYRGCIIELDKTWNNNHRDLVRRVIEITKMSLEEFGKYQEDERRMRDRLRHAYAMRDYQNNAARYS